MYTRPFWLRALRVAAVVFALAALLFSVADDAEAQSLEYGCETYGCLYDHDPKGHYRRGGPPPSQERPQGIAYELLPEGGPDGRRFLQVFWPGGYDPARRPNWDRVAECESGGRWHIATGNGYYGGLQFSRSTWSAYGGGEYASRADWATPEQQIDVANRVAFTGTSQHRPQGLRAWPHCGKRF